LNLLVCIPTVTGRAHYLEQAIRSYRERTPGDVNINISIVKDRRDLRHRLAGLC
jgi:hypothetical protein